MGQRIFIHHNGALGDLLLSLPAITLLRKPGDVIHLAGRRDAVEFLKKIGYIHEGSDSDSVFFLPLFMDPADKPVRDFLPLRNFLAGFDRILLFVADKSSVLVGNVLTVAPHTEVIGTVPPEGLGMHVSDFRLRQIESTGLPQHKTDADLPELPLPSCYRNMAEEMLRREGYDFESPLVALHPGSGGKRKCWPLENYFTLIETVAAKHDAVFLIFSGPAEDRATKGRIKDFVRGKRGMIHVCDKDLVTVAALLSLAALYVGNDSGITHLAAAVNGRVVVLFGPTDQVLWKPLGARVQVVSSGSPGGPPSAITVNTVIERILSFPFP